MEAERYAFKTSKRKIVHLPVNRIDTPYQTEKALDEDKIKENMRRMRRGERLEPCVIGYDYDLHDGHHRLEAAKRLGHTHVPCRVGGTDDEKAQKAYDEYTQAYKAFRVDELEKAQGKKGGESLSARMKREFPGGEWRTVHGHHVYIHDGIVRSPRPKWMAEDGGGAPSEGGSVTDAKGGKLHASIHFTGHSGHAYGGEQAARDLGVSHIKDPELNDDHSHFKVTFPNFDFKDRAHNAVKDIVKKHSMGYDAESKAWKVPVHKYQKLMSTLKDDERVVTRHTPEGKEAADTVAEYVKDTRELNESKAEAYLEAQNDDKPPVDPHLLPGTETFYGAKKPHPYQWKGVNWLMRARKGNLGFDVGLGKTITAITAAESLKHQYGGGRGRDERMNNPTVIIAPASKLYGWQDDINEIMEGKNIKVIDEGNSETKAHELKAAFEGGEKIARDPELHQWLLGLHGMSEHPDKVFDLADRFPMMLANAHARGVQSEQYRVLRQALQNHIDKEPEFRENSKGNKVKAYVSKGDKELAKKIMDRMDEYATGKRKPKAESGLTNSGKPDYVIMSYETARDHGHHIKGQTGITIVDEAHYLKGNDSARSKKIEANFGQSPYHWWLSATPMPNKLEEAYRAMQFFNPSVLGTFDDFKEKYCLTDTMPIPKYDPVTNEKKYMYVDKVVGYKNHDEFKKAIAPYFFMKNTESPDVKIDLPKLNKHTAPLQMDEHQLKAYNRAKTDLQKALGGDSGNSKASAAQLVALGKMLAAAVDPRLAYKDMKVPEGYVAPKIRQAAEALANNHDNTKKGGIVFCNSPEALDYLKDYMKKTYGYADSDFGVIKGGVSSKKKAQVEKDFNAGKVKFALGTSAGEAGINLQKNSNLHINLDETWTPAGMQQREGRGYRQGQKNPFTIMTYLARGSAEERRSTLLAKKRDLISKVFTEGGDLSKLSGALTVDDMRYMMGDDTDALLGNAPTKKARSSAASTTKRTSSTKATKKSSTSTTTKATKTTKKAAPSVTKKAAATAAKTTKKTTAKAATAKKSSSAKASTGKMGAKSTKPTAKVTVKPKKGAKK